MNDDNQKPENNRPITPPAPFTGSEEIIKNLRTLPDDNTPREDLLSQVVSEPTSSSPQNQPAPTEEGSNEPG